jgi:hypothetical protein
LDSDDLNIFFLRWLNNVVRFLCFNLTPLNGFINLRMILSRFHDRLLHCLFIHVLEVILLYWLCFRRDMLSLRGFLHGLSLGRCMLSCWGCFAHREMIWLNYLTCTP